MVATLVACGQPSPVSREPVAVRLDPLTPVPGTKLSPSQYGAGHAFGSAVDYDGDTLVVGSPGALGGRVFVFRLQGAGFVEDAMLVPSDTSDAQDFGSSVAVDGPIIVVGAPDEDDHGPGLAVVYRRGPSGWLQEAELDEGLDPGARFGTSVDVDEGRVVVGAPHTGAQNEDGQAFVFADTGSGWELEDVLAPQGSALFGDPIGESISIHGNWIALGNPTSALMGFDTVFMYTLAGSTWDQMQELVPPAGSGYRFGSDLDLHGDRLVIGSPAEAGGNVDPFFAVYTLEGSKWQIEQLVYRPFQESRAFASSVALADDLLWVGSPLADNGGADSGMVAVYTSTPAGWTLLQDFVTADTVAGNKFGMAVAAFGSTALVGAPGDSTVVNEAGSAWTVNLMAELGEPCPDTSACLSGFCVDGVCCDSACSGGPADCMACSVAAGAEENGICGVATGSTCDDGEVCTNAGVCLVGTCTPGAVADDGTPCPGGTCESGVCVGPDGGAAGSAGASGGSGGAMGGAAGSAAGGAAGGGGGSAGIGGGAAGTVPGNPSTDAVESSGFYACGRGVPSSGAAPLVGFGLLLIVAGRRRREDAGQSPP